MQAFTACQHCGPVPLWARLYECFMGVRCEVQTEKSVPRVIVGHHEALPSDAEQ